jgi:hypothetical protein
MFPEMQQAYETVRQWDSEAVFQPGIGPERQWDS